MGQVTVTIVEFIVLLLIRSKLGETATSFKTTTRQATPTTGTQRTTSTLTSLTPSRSPSVVPQEQTIVTQVLPATSFKTTTRQATPTTGRQRTTPTLMSLTPSRSPSVVPQEQTIVTQVLPATGFKTTTRQATPTTGRQRTTPTLTSLTPSRSPSVVPQEQTIVTQVLPETTQTLATELTTAGTTFTAKSCSTEAINGSGWMFAAGLVSGLAIAAVIAGVVYIFNIRRLCVSKKPEPGPASQNHPTYAGFTNLGRPDTYDVIDRPEAVTRPSDTIQAPVYQNVKDAP